jgi:hypothetical protein
MDGEKRLARLSAVALGRVTVTFQLTHIVLYPHGGDEPRTLVFGDQISVITGDSKTGKSSLIDIVDYCLGSRVCRVAHGVIRSTVAWYAARFDLAGQQIFIARRAPGESAQSSGEVYVQQGLDLPIPTAAELHAVTSRDGLIALLTEYLGMPATGSGEQTLLPDYDLSVRHAVPYIFQKQYELSSPNVLFHRAGEDFIARDLRETAPFFVGAITVDDISASRQLAVLRREARDLRARLDAIEAAVGVDASRAIGLVQEAIEVGLVDAQTVETRSDAIQALRNIQDSSSVARETDSAPVDSAEPDTLRQELRRLLGRQSALRTQYNDLREQLEAMRAFGALRGAFGAEASEQEARLTSVELLPPAGSDDRVCPLCDTPLSDASLESLRTTISAFAQDPPQLQATADGLHTDIERIRDELATTTSQITVVQQSRDELAELVDRRQRQTHVLGRASLYLETVRESDDAGELRDRLRVVGFRITELEERISATAVRERLASVSAGLTQDMGVLSAGLEMEWSGLPIFLDFRRLTVGCETANGPVFLDQMGSGENWVAYHLLAHLALHRLFAQRNRPVPRFIFLDQPSQVYFPTDADIAAAAAGERSGDMAAVARLIRLIFDAARDQGFQVVLTEHANFDDEWFRSAVIEDWHEGQALIPSTWL